MHFERPLKFNEMKTCVFSQSKKQLHAVSLISKICLIYDLIKALILTKNWTTFENLQ